MMLGQTEGPSDAASLLMLGQHLRVILDLEQYIAAVDVPIETYLVPFADAVDRLMTILNVSRLVAEVTFAKIGLEMKCPAASDSVLLIQ